MLFFSNSYLMNDKKFTCDYTVKNVNFLVMYDARVINYDRRVFVRLIIYGSFHLLSFPYSYTNQIFPLHCTNSYCFCFRLLSLCGHTEQYLLLFYQRHGSNTLSLVLKCLNMPRRRRRRSHLESTKCL